MGAIIVLIVIAYAFLRRFIGRKATDAVKTDETVKLAEQEDSNLAEWADKNQMDVKRTVPLGEGEEWGGESTNVLIVYRCSCDRIVV